MINTWAIELTSCPFLGGSLLTLYPVHQGTKAVERRGSKAEMARQMVLFVMSDLDNSELGIGGAKYRLVPLPMYLDEITTDLYDYINYHQG